MYRYELHPWNGKRRIAAGYIRREGYPEARSINEFEPVQFSEEYPYPYPEPDVYEGFITSPLETLVMLFTGEDPAMAIGAVDCDHEFEDDGSCPCPPITIEIPAVLALHSVNLMQQIEMMKFTEISDRDGDPIRNFDHLDGSEHRMIWRRMEKIMNRWYEQGIALHRAWLESGRAY